MQIKFKLGKYNKTSTGFEHLGYDTFVITFLKSNKKENLRVVVNNVLTRKKLQLLMDQIFHLKKQY